MHASPDAAARNLCPAIGELFKATGSWRSRL